MNSNAPFRLGDWLVQPDLNRVTGPDGEVRLEPRVMLVLARLAAAPGEVVSRDTLLDEVWEGTFVGEESLTRAISDLRRTFGDDARRPAYIETIRQRGYRLIAEVAPVPASAPPPALETAPPVAEPAAAPPPTPAPPAEPPATAPSAPGRGFRPWGTVAAVAVIALLFVGQRLLRQDEAPPAALTDAAPGSVPLTTYPGHERQPALAADGTRVAFAWSGPDGGQEGIWVKQRNSETPLRLSSGPGRASWPCWSPDAQSVAWVQALSDGSEIRTVAGLGGGARTLLAVPGSVAGLDWAPDGAALLYAARDTVSGLHRLWRLDLASLVVDRVEVDAGAAGSDIQPRLAPDGVRLAWIHLGAGGGSELWTGTPGGRDARALVSGLTNLAGLAWTSDGAGVVFAAEHAGMYHLWSVAATGGEPRRLTGPGDFAWHPAVARGAGDLVYEQVRVDQDLWRVRVVGRAPWRLETDRFLVSTRWEYGADYSPDGSLIAFVSARSGTPELWVCDRSGGDLRQITDTGTAAVSGPRWSPDGTRIAHNVVQDGRSRVGVASLRGGPARMVTPAGDSETLAGWARTGGAVEVVRRGEGAWALLRRSLADAATEVVATGVTAAARDPQGGLYVVREGLSGIWRARGGDFELVVGGLDAADRGNWRLAGDRLYWVLRSGGQAYLMIHDLDGSADVFLTDLPGFAGAGLAVSADGNEVLYPRAGAAEGDLVLVPGDF